MRNLFFILVVLSGLGTKTWAADARPLKVAEKIPENAKFVKPGQKLTDSLRLRFNTLTSIAKLTYQSEMGKKFPVIFDIMASDYDFNKIILLGAEQQMSADQANKLYKFSGGIYAPIALESKPVSLIFIGFSLDEVQSVIREFNKTYAVNSTNGSPSRMPASELTDPVSAGPATNDSYAKQAQKFAYALGIESVACLKGVYTGLMAIPNIFYNGFVSIYNLAVYPKWWVNQSAKEIAAYKENVTHFDEFASRQWSDWKQKTPEEKEAAYCSIVGGAGAGKMLGAAADAANALGKVETVARAGSTASADAASTANSAADEGMTALPAKILYKANKAPANLSSDAANIVEAKGYYAGRSSWVVHTPESAEAYPYLADRMSLRYLKAMTENKIPDPATIKDSTLQGVARKVKDYASVAQQRINTALKGPDVAIGDRNFVVVQGTKYPTPRLATAADYKPAPQITNHGLDYQRIIDGNPPYRSISSPRYNKFDRGTISANTTPPPIQGAQVKVVYGDKVIEGEYISSGGPGIPRGASLPQLSPYQAQEVLVHFIRVADQVVMVPAEGAEIFAQYR